jgi:flagellar biogenesis protein FliO
MSIAGPTEIDVGMLALIGALILALSALHWWLRARVARPDGPIRVVASQGLGAKRALALVEVEGTRLLLGLTDERIACLARLEAPARALPVLRRVAGGGEAS